MQAVWTEFQLQGDRHTDIQYNSILNNTLENDIEGGIKNEPASVGSAA